MRSGACKNGLADGEGILLWFYRDAPNGLSFRQGGFQGGGANGLGVAEWADSGRDWHADCGVQVPSKSAD